MDEDGAGSPRRLPFELVDHLPTLLGLESPCEGDELGAGLEFVAKGGDLGHDIASIAGAAHKDNCAVAPVELRNQGSTSSKSAL